MENDDDAGIRLRVLSWNIWWRFGSWKQRRAAISATIAESDADVIALQEVWRDEETDYAAELAAEFGYHHVYAQSMIMNDIGFGNAILSRWPIARHETLALTCPPNTGDGRLVLYAEIDGPRGTLPVFNTHLSWRPEDSHIRQRQVGEIAGFIDKLRTRKFPPILCGDFNADPMAEEIRMLTGLATCPVEGLVFDDAWTWANGDKPGPTWDNANPHAAANFETDRRIDYILVGWPRPRGNGQVLACRLMGNQAIDDVWPSDHFGVLADIRYAKFR